MRFMIYSEFIEEIKKIKFLEKRVDSPNLLEFVINQEQLNTLTPMLQSYFGLPLKPAGQAPSREANTYSAAYGGIKKNQTLYYLDPGAVNHCALLWPWSDGKWITVKIAQVPKK
ncbi:MAG TPA: hypothetical protein VJC08_04340 [bacterium]|nr:hypothetical protein [bacterium]